jgi:hypothetical protein
MYIIIYIYISKEKRINNFCSIHFLWSSRQANKRNGTHNYNVVSEDLVTFQKNVNKNEDESLIQQSLIHVVTSGLSRKN